MSTESSEALNVIIDAALSPAVSRAVRMVIELDVLDLLDEGPAPAAELAARCGTGALGLRQALRATARAGLVRALDDGAFALTGPGRRLTREHPGSVRDLVLSQLSPLFAIEAADTADAVDAAWPGERKSLGRRRRSRERVAAA